MLQGVFRYSKPIRGQFNYSLTLGYRPEIINLVSTAILDLEKDWKAFTLGNFLLGTLLLSFMEIVKKTKDLTFLPNKSNQIQHFCFVKMQIMHGGGSFFLVPMLFQSENV